MPGMLFQVFMLLAKETRISYPQTRPYKNYLELKAIRKQHVQEKLFLPSPFSAWRQSINSPFTGNRLLEPKDRARGICKQTFLPQFPLTDLPSHSLQPWGPSFPLSCHSLQICSSLLKTLAGVQSQHFELFLVKRSPTWCTLHPL